VIIASTLVEHIPHAQHAVKREFVIATSCAKDFFLLMAQE
jgi:hypothetical protein